MNAAILRKINYFFPYLFFICLFPFTLLSQVRLPDTPAGFRGQQILDLLNGKLGIAPKEFVRQNCSESFKNRIPENQWGGLLNQLMKMSPNADLIRINKSEDYEIEFIIQLASNKMYITVTTAVEETPPYYISAMRFIPGGRIQADGTAQTQTALPKVPSEKADTEIIKNIKNYLIEQAKKDKFSGSVLVARDGNILLEETFGYANKRFRVLNKFDTKFNLGSLNKSFTTVGVLQLAEDGKIGIDDPIGKYLNYFPKDVADKVTIRQLLTMSSGWGDYWDNEYYLCNKDELRTVNEYMRFIRDTHLDFEPGTSTKHSNTGFEVAGAIIEKVSGLDYFDYVREKIYKPAGMTNSDSYDRDGPVENLATGYTNNNIVDTIHTGWQWENTYILSPRGTPAGGGYSTIEDLMKYDIALRNEKLISKEYFNFMCNGLKGNIGDPFTPNRVLRNAGGAPGVSTFFARDMIHGYSIIVLSNYDHPVGINIGNEIIKMLKLE